MASPPDVHDARPACCPFCGAASAPPGGPLGLHGHGTRERTVRGVLAPEEAPQFHTVRVRRYRCAHCHATCTVVPLDVLPYKHFGAVTIALALALYGALQRSLHAVYATLNPTKIRGDSARGWDSVLRWIATVAELFPEVRESPSEWSSRQIAARAAMTLAARVRDESLPIPSRVAFAACHLP